MESENTTSVSLQKNEKKKISKQVRSTNFNTNETLKLEELVKQNFEVLNSKLTNQVTNSMKGQLWKEISRQVSCLGYAHRSEKTCMEKWANLKRKAKDEITKEKLNRRKTGGGPFTGASQQSARIGDLFADSASFSGIEGGLDSDETDGLHFISNTSVDDMPDVHDKDSDAQPTSISPAKVPVFVQPIDTANTKSFKRPSGSKLSNSVKRPRSRNDVLMDYQIQYFKGMVERQGLERELMEVKLRILKSAENKLDELNARELLNIISEQ